ncbi:hypothetical protein ASC75_08280 [Aminobacter sp. DSM 101952]|uniref:hypothetical protein n=1 Tax=unclassified Aminobacter TaxID=2644704 RepID=UPI0006FA6162|nr:MULTISPECIES: hypothetical protein [unclassified Aminobacter]AWC23655.1 Isovaleryl-homoserine lactone synthase [Aminobacter sp. MSH1]KQU70109.1 hypothetical protein ASC75_08280 [Aminobacter sp. DSM 101952]
MAQLKVLRHLVRAMFKLHIVDWSNRQTHQNHLERYFRIRYEIYVVGRKWQHIDRPVPLEIDAFDIRDTIYLLGIDDTGNIAIAVYRPGSSA